jgi:hypothetical protein
VHAGPLPTWSRRDSDEEAGPERDLIANVSSDDVHDPDPWEDPWDDADDADDGVDVWRTPDPPSAGSDDTPVTGVTGHVESTAEHGGEGDAPRDR